jgi:hypothetical protein
MIDRTRDGAFPKPVGENPMISMPVDERRPGSRRRVRWWSIIDPAVGFACQGACHPIFQALV